MWREYKNELASTAKQIVALAILWPMVFACRP
jgi:hypothetical protein